MVIFSKKADVISVLEQKKHPNSTIGFVPTMGALHQGHLSLLKKSLEENTITVISIFVNPTQFNNLEDLEKYPRTLEQDLNQIGTISKDIIVFAPTVDEIYEGNTAAKHFEFDGLEHQMEGKFRPGHFDGVGTIVKRLFEIISPTNAYFGEKDFQQLQIVKKLVNKYHIPVTIVGCPIFREANGLAMSSRNERLTATERELGSLIYKTLCEAKNQFSKKSTKKITDFVKNTFDKNSHFEFEYFEIADEETLLPCIRKSKHKKYRAFIAVFINKIRLIDTISLN
ncbi:pantoate--beta-alanine ligase [Flavobacterium aciduliphilum]|uniref:Pantothenate synthetase n=1 Tax=Flavobacterium aciduliphilum TaxID=1101402 RepID=A0A328YG43_9FLAO|nr:pantoate--beta-alanine ligase [Flavobacterium aciduliphilum]RAR72580.1 pantothenate synthetase [Flavobacterium aciduliphilum]